MVDITFAFGVCLYPHTDALEEAAKLTEDGVVLFFVHLTFFSSEAWAGGRGSHVGKIIWAVFIRCIHCVYSLYSIMYVIFVL